MHTDILARFQIRLNILPASKGVDKVNVSQTTQESISLRFLQ